MTFWNSPGLVLHKDCVYAVASSPHSAVHTKEHPSAGARCYAYHHPATEIATQWSIEFQAHSVS